MNILEPKEISIQPTYLLTVSGLVEILNQFYQQQKMGSLTGPFKKHLESTFITLGQSLFLYDSEHQQRGQKNHSFAHSALLKAKGQIEAFCWQKLAYLLGKQSKQIGKIMNELIALNRQHIQDFQKVVIEQRKSRIYDLSQQRQQLIKNLRKQIEIKSDHMKDIQGRLCEVQQENSNLYSKLITNAKSTIQYSLSPSKGSGQRQKVNSVPITSVFPKIKQPISSHKTLTIKQVQQIIFDVMQTKVKRQAVKGRKVSVDNFLNTYFRYKFGMRELAEEAESSFRQALDYFAKTQQKNIFVLFVTILNQKCNESYFFQSKSHYQKITKCVKRYIHAKNGTNLDQLQKIYEVSLKHSSIEQKYDINLNEKDINVILGNIYGTQEVQSLQNIFIQLIESRKQQWHESQTYSDKNIMPSKKIINQILNYQLKKYLFSIEDILRGIREVDTQNKGYFNYSEFENIAIKSGLSNERLALLAQNSEEWQTKFLTSSEVIEIIVKIKKTKVKRK